MQGKAPAIIIIFLLLTLLFIQCSNEESPNEPIPNENEIILAEEVNQADSITFKDNLITIDSTKIIYSSGSQYAASVKVGDILVSDFGKGVLRKVTNILENNDQIIFETRRARLDEVIVKGKISYRGPLDLNNIQLINTSENMLRINKHANKISINFSGITLGLGNKLNINAGTEFEVPEIVFELDFNWGIKRANISATVDNETFIEIVNQSEVFGGGSYSPAWAQFAIPPGIPTGIPGIHIIPVIKVVFSGKVSVSTASSNRVDISSTLQSGLLYESGNFTPQSSFTQSFQQASDLVETAELSGGLSIPRFGFYLAGAAGAYLELRGDGVFRVASDNQGLYKGVYGKLSANGGFELDVFGFGLTYSTEIKSQEWELYKKYIEEINKPPEKPYNPIPANNSINISVDTVLTWECSDPDGDPLNYNIYFGTTTNPILASQNQSSKSYTPPTLNDNTTYYWQVLAKDNNGDSTFSDIWSFTTETNLSNNPPATPSNPSPEDGAIEVPVNTTLSWECSDPDGDPITYDIYFGTNPNPQLKEANYSSNSYNTGTLNENTSYYWRIVAKDNNGNTTNGVVWNFTTSDTTVTMGIPCPGIPTVEYEGKIYNTVQIGEQCWLKENLDVGTMIESNSLGFQQTDNGIIEKYCYDNDPANCETYGGLYEWPEAMQYTTTEGSQGICPNGWHIPTLSEFEALETYVNDQAAALIDESETLNHTLTVTQNETGFSVLLAGLRSFVGTFHNLGFTATLWGSTESSSTNATNMYMYTNDSRVFFYNYDKDDGFNIRCIKD